ncbi:hypothetical protein A0J61_04569 [Choanephora cucurbitarum]|uniref:Uncharacterized protein n=1 Tax=Choanephora cucurbitarum TaxID=101091 RepID=A0A1C7NEK9_9FUNG|nr:hypothetical protein A0J61_04569 [Choanephora cucurbitarum]
MLPNGYPSYKRTQTNNDAHHYSFRHPTRKKKVFEATNEWVVLYSSYLLKRYKANINVECCASIDAIKYINKYIYKGQDHTILKISDSNNEVEKYLHARYIGPLEAVWRLFEFPIHEEDPTVVLLSVYLPDKQTVYFDPQFSDNEIREKLNNSKTMLMSWFEYNQQNTDRRGYLYQEFFEHFVFSNNDKTWKPRQKEFAIGRMLYINPEACLQLHLIEADDEWSNCFREAALFTTGSSLRSLFAIDLVYGQLSQPSSTWNKFCFEICDDLDHKLHQLLPNQIKYLYSETEKFRLG